MANPGNALGIFEDGDIYDQYDLNLFYKTLTYARLCPNTTHFRLANLCQAPNSSRHKACWEAYRRRPDWY